MPEHTIAENLTRLQNAKTAIGNAITAKGGTVAASDGLEEFAADIATITNQYTSSDEGKVVSGGQLVAQTDYGTVTENGTYNTTENNSVTVNVASTGKQIEPLTITNSHFSAQNIFILYDNISMDIYGNCNVSYMSASDLYATYQSDIDVSRLLNKNVMMGGTSSHMKFKISSIDTTTKTITLDTSTGSQNFQTSVYAFASYT